METNQLLSIMMDFKATPAVNRTAVMYCELFVLQKLEDFLKSLYKTA